MATVEIEAEVRLKRYIYFCSEESRYICTSKPQHDCCQLSKITSFFELITAKKESDIMEMIDSVKKDTLRARKESLLFLLAALIRNATSNENRTKAYDKILEVCNTTEELFLFIKFAHCLNIHFSHGLRRIICNYYLKKEPMDLLHVITHGNSYYGWSHNDIFKLIHIKSPKNTAQEVIISYIMRDIKFVKRLIDNMEKNENLLLIHDIFSLLEKFDKLKHCHSDQEAVELIKENNFKIYQIPAQLLKSQIVWECLIPSLEIPELLPQLVRLNRLGFLKSNNPDSALNKVVEILSNTKKCVASKIQPAQALIYLKTFERGKPIDPRKKNHIVGLSKANGEETNSESTKKEKGPVYFNPPKNKAVISALYKLLNHSFKNVQPTGRRFLITLDTKEENMKNLCYINKAVTCLEAAVIIAFSLLKSEKDVTIAVFDDVNINIVQIDKNITYAQAFQKLKENKGGHVILHNTFSWAMKNNKSVDVFLNLMFSPHCLIKAPKEIKNSENILLTLKRYRQKMHLPNTKFINVSLGRKTLRIADGSPHVLDICGFDHHVPKLIEACCKGILQ